MPGWCGSGIGGRGCGDTFFTPSPYRVPVVVRSGDRRRGDGTRDCRTLHRASPGERGENPTEDLKENESDNREAHPLTDRQVDRWRS